MPGLEKYEHACAIEWMYVWVIMMRKVMTNEVWECVVTRRPHNSLATVMHGMLGKIPGSWIQALALWPLCLIPKNLIHSLHFMFFVLGRYVLLLYIHKEVNEVECLKIDASDSIIHYVAIYCK